MRNRKGFALVLLLSVILLLGWQGPVSAQNAGARQEKGATQLGINGDYFTAGNTVDFTEKIAGDLYAAGNDVLAQGDTGGDVLAVGRSINVGGNVGGSIRAAGSQVTVGGKTLRNATIACQQLAITQEGLISGNAYLAGQTIDVNGKVGGDLRAAASTVVINGEIGRDAQITADRVVVLPGAKIGGALKYCSKNPAEISPEAQIEGGVTQIPVSPGGASAKHAGFSIIRALLSLAALLLAALVFVLLLPRCVYRVATTVRTQPWLCLGIGCAGMLVPPFLAIILFITVVGMQLGWIVLAGYLAFLSAGFLLGRIMIGFLAGGLILRALEKRDRASAVWSVLLGATLLKLVSYIPVLGWLIGLFTGIFTMGALLYLAGRTWFQPEPPPEAPAQP